MFKDRQNMNQFSFQQSFWALFFCLLFIPITNTFIVNLSKLVRCFINNYAYKSSLHQLIGENNTLKNKVNYYRTKDGYKSLIKERLEKLDDGEILIKYSD